MERYVDISEISDGKKYTAADLVKVGCGDCAGCSDCCVHMENLITLDPYDVYRMREMPFASLMQEHVELMVDRGIIIPVLKMDEKTGRCTFLDENGRCKIHSIRPGICRLFPMGRVYEDGDFYYFLQKDECNYPGKTKVKLKKWLDTPELSTYEKYICDWHYFVSDLQKKVVELSDEAAKQLNMLVLQLFFFAPYGDQFYMDFYARLEKVKNELL